MKQKLIIMAALIAISPILVSFCGIYVSKSDGTLKNKASQVILVRDGNKTIVTMYNDFKGNAKDFAMVIPVPVLLKKSDIKVVDQSIFQKLNDYSAPRLVEYYDQNPCYGNEQEDNVRMLSSEVKSVPMASVAKARKKYGVKIEAQYLVGEYDILILSAKESGGLKEWLLQNGYKIPAGAEEVLEPYIKSNLKFFVAKVNKQYNQQKGGAYLRPLQIKFSSPKFILPIRLGMANGDGDQDLIVYSFTKRGRVECVNYRNVDMHTGTNIPLFVNENFDKFYTQAFTNKWNKEGKNIGLLEYAWDVSPVNTLKCDPCVGNPPNQQDLVQAGVWWLGGDPYDYSDVDDLGNSNTFFTRIHFRYNRKSFPQDLVFQVTPNKQSFQSRYVVTHPASGDFSCDAGKQYVEQLKKRRKQELRNLVTMTGSTLSQYLDEGLTIQEENQPTTAANYAQLITEVTQEYPEKTDGAAGMVFVSLLMVSGAGLLRWKGLI